MDGDHRKSKLFKEKISTCLRSSSSKSRDTSNGQKICFKALEENQCLGALFLDLSKFFDGLERDVGNSLVQVVMGQGSNALGYAKAERIFTEQSRAIVKVGKAVQTPGNTRGNGFLQGRCYSTEVALKMMSVWTRAVEKEAEVPPLVSWTTVQ